MKSAYELAMERLKEGDTEERQSLTQEQKEALAGIDKEYAAKIAEREIFLQKQLADALDKGEPAEAEQIKTQIAGEKARMEEEKEDKKNRIRNQAK